MTAFKRIVPEFPPARGSFLVIKVDGSVAIHEKKPTLANLKKALGYDCVDVVSLTRKDVICMIVDDNFVRDNLPVNPKATALYWITAVPGDFIHGDVAIAYDDD